MNSETTIKENCSNCEYNRQCFIKKQLGALECQKDKDYITNLQQENKQLKNILTELEKWLISHLDDEYFWSKIYWYLEELKEKYK